MKQSNKRKSTDEIDLEALVFGSSSIASKEIIADSDKKNKKNNNGKKELKAAWIDEHDETLKVKINEGKY